MVLKSAIKTILFASVLILFMPAEAQEKFPEYTKDGLKLTDHTRRSALYVKPGATLAGYDRIKILDCFVQFQKNWQRDYNRNQMGLDHHVSDQDMERIKKEVATEFPVAFGRVMEQGGYTVVDETGQGILLLRPAIINLSISAPDKQTAGSIRTFVQSAGTMTLYMEIYDSATSTKIAEVIDNEIRGNDAFGYQGNPVRNRSDFDRTIEVWAGTLLRRLSEANDN